MLPKHLPYRYIQRGENARQALRHIDELVVAAEELTGTSGLLRVGEKPENLHDVARGMWEVLNIKPPFDPSADFTDSINNIVDVINAVRKERGV